MIYYPDFPNGENSRKITLEEFKEIFNDWDEELDFPILEEFEDQFDKLCCAKDPYQYEINSINMPVVEANPDELYEEWYELTRNI